MALVVPVVPPVRPVIVAPVAPVVPPVRSVIMAPVAHAVPPVTPVIVAPVPVVPPVSQLQQQQLPRNRLLQLPGINLQTLSVIFTPTDTATYNTASQFVTINVLTTSSGQSNNQNTSSRQLNNQYRNHDQSNNQNTSSGQLNNQYRNCLLYTSP